MSRNDYTKYSNKNEVGNEPEVIAPVNEPEQEVVTAEPDVPVETAETAETVEPSVESKKIGRVFDCVRLNVRSASYGKAPIVCDIPCDTEVEIDENDSTDEFYKVYLASGVEGYCMKKYILKN